VRTLTAEPRELTSLSVSIDLKGAPPEADCLDCLVALPLAIDQMRSATDDRDIPHNMIEKTRDAFGALAGRERRAILLAVAGCQDLLYRHIANLTVMDRYTKSYFIQVVRYFFMQLSGHNIRTFYILDNAIRDDRLAAVLTLFDQAGISTATPRRDGKEWSLLSARIRERMENIGHVAYIEPDSEVNHLEAAKILARELECVATFRCRAPTEDEIDLLKLSDCD
jgi:hypothetical protein